MSPLLERGDDVLHASGASDEAPAANGREMEAALVRAGFSEVRVETLRLKPAAVCALGVNGVGA